jgi:hypothetical protein
LAWTIVPMIKDPAEAMTQPTTHGPIWLLCVLLAWGGFEGGGGPSSLNTALAPLSGSAANATAAKIVTRLDLRIQASPAIVQFCLPCFAGSRSVFWRNETPPRRGAMFIRGEKWTAISIVQ